MSIVRNIREHASEYSRNPAVIDSDQTWSYGEFFDRVDRLSNAFLELGLHKGRVLLCWLPNVREALETELACLQIGGIWVTLNAGLTWPEVELVVRSTQPAVFVTDSSLLGRITPSSPEVKADLSAATLFLRGDGIPSTLFASRTGFENAIAGAPADVPRIDVDEADVARLRYTSGTTGNAKAAILSHRAYRGSLVNLREHLHQLGPSDRVLHAAPLTHASAALSYPILAAGGASVIMPTFDAEKVLETIESHRITTMFAVPTMLQRLASTPSFRTRDLSSIRTISYGGAPMPVTKIEPLIERLGPVFMQIYGLTEALHPVTCLRRDQHFKGNPKLGSAGTLTSTCQIRVVDDDGQDVNAGEIGEFWIKGSIVFDGYWQDDAETERTLRDGWVASGDLGYRDADGFYWIVDRKKNVIISGGFNVYASEIESTLAGHPAVADVAVIGIPHDDWGEAVHAVVNLKAGQSVDETALIAWGRSRLAGYKTPKSVTFSQEPLPRNSAGKLARAAVVERVKKTIAVRADR